MALAFTIFSKLPGTWIFSRSIPNFGIMNGRAIFSSISNETNFLHYREEGILTQEATNISHDFSKEYLYGYSNSEITIYFNEKPRKIYHVLNLKKQNTCEADHQCINDQYHGLYDFKEIDRGSFKITYRVKGPKKDNRIITLFTREKK